MSKIDRFNSEIAEKIKNGSYYKEAWDWYALKYIYPVSQRTFFIFITSAAIIITIIAFSSIFNFYPLTVRVPMAVKISDMTLDYSKILKIPVPPKGDVTTPVARYLVRQYVDKIESYDIKHIDRQLKFLSQFSAPPLMKEIEKRYDKNNLDSLILKYRDHTTRSVEISNVRVEPGEGFDLVKASQNVIVLDNVPFSAIVDFESQEVNLLGTTAHKWEATIIFTMSPVVFDKAKKSFKPLDFRVSNYSVSQLQ